MATIKLSNDVLIDNTSLKIFIDTTNQLVSSNGGSQTSKTWTATEDCWLWAYGYDGDVTIDNKSIGYAPSYTHNCFTLVRKGAKVKATAGYNQAHALYAWGFK